MISISLISDPIPLYLALSYAWGDSTRVEQISVNGYNIPVAARLHNALLYLKTRSQNEGRYRIWIDALCINQADVEERSQQVAIMRDIYTGATEVVAWLGYCQQDELAMDLLEKIEKILDEDGMESRELAETLIEHHFLPEWEAFTNLMEVDYWERLWILQEIIVAKTVRIQCGQRHVSWNALEAAFRMMDHNPALVTTSQRKALERSFPAKIIPYRFKRRKDFTLLSFMNSFNNSLCSDERDRVFALLGLVEMYGDTTTSWKSLRPDYSLTLFQLYQQLLCVHSKDDDLDVHTTFDTVQLGVCSNASIVAINFSQSLQRIWAAGSLIYSNAEATLASTGHYDPVPVTGIIFGTLITEISTDLDIVALSSVPTVDQLAHPKAGIKPLTRPQLLALQQDLQQDLQLEGSRHSCGSHLFTSHDGLSEANSDEKTTSYFHCCEQLADLDPLSTEDMPKVFCVHTASIGDLSAVVTYNAAAGDSLVRFISSDVACVVRPMAHNDRIKDGKAYSSSNLYHLVGRAVVELNSLEERPYSPITGFPLWQYSVPAVYHFKKMNSQNIIKFSLSPRTLHYLTG